MISRSAAINTSQDKVAPVAGEQPGNHAAADGDGDQNADDSQQQHGQGT